MIEKGINPEASVKQTIQLQLIKEILIENKLITHDEFENRFTKKVNEAPISEELKDLILNK